MPFPTNKALEPSENNAKVLVTCAKILGWKQSSFPKLFFRKAL